MNRIYTNSNLYNRVYHDLNHQPIAMDVHRLPNCSGVWHLRRHLQRSVFNLSINLSGFDSCLEGCFYNEEEGADMDAQYECFQEAACDTFKLLNAKTPMEHNPMTDTNLTLFSLTMACASTMNSQGIVQTSILVMLPNVVLLN